MSNELVERPEGFKTRRHKEIFFKESDLKTNKMKK